MDLEVLKKRLKHEFTYSDIDSLIERCEKAEANAIVTDNTKTLAAALERNAELEAELENERMRLAACSIAALGCFDGCDEKYKSASLDDVLRLQSKLCEMERQEPIGQVYSKGGRYGYGSFAKNLSPKMDASVVNVYALPVPQQSEWQPIETAPKDGTDILLLCKLNHNKGKVHIGAYHYEDRFWWNHSGTFVSSPSFWMPLPLPPITK